MSTVGFSTLDVIPSVRGLRASLEKQTSGDFAAAGRKGGQQFGDAAGKEAGGRFKSKFAPIAKEAFAPVAGLVAGAGVLEFFKGAINGASDLAETASKMRVIFGDAAKGVEAFAKDSQRNILLTQQEAEDAASTFGIFGKSAGLTGKQLTDFSVKLTGLASDLSSFSNTSTTQAIDSIGAALRGETEPIRAYGVLLDDASLRQEAMREGLIQTTKNALTPQQRVLAAYNLILKQTVDAQGDAARTQSGYANSVRKLQKGFHELEVEVGQKLLPSLTAGVNLLNDKVIPGLESAGGVAGDAGRAFGGLPDPIKAATAALLALRVAEATGITAKLATGADGVKTSFNAAAQRVGFFNAAYSNARAEVFAFGRESGVASGQVTKLSASLAGIRAASFGAGAGLKKGLSGALNLVGGPWGAAFIAGTAVVAHFWQEHERAKQRVEEFTSTLDKETGALTKSSREYAANQLLQAGVLKDAQKLGISLSTVTDAALNQAGALSKLATQLQAIIVAGTTRTSSGQDVLSDRAQAASDLANALTSTNGVVQTSVSRAKLLAEATGETATATSRATESTSNYTEGLSKAREAVGRLYEAENKRRNANLSDAQDRLSLVKQLQAAREEAAKGAKTLDVNTKAGQDNKQALLDLAQQWNNSSASVQNAKGSYDRFKQSFIQIAEKMGASKTQAEKLAGALLTLPKSKVTTINTPGMDKALADVKKLKDGLKAAQTYASNIAVGGRGRRLGSGNEPAMAGGGLLRGPGTGTSDSILMWGSNGEFMQRKAAVDHYGIDFMRRLNNLQVPKFAGGGPIAPVTQSVTKGGVTIDIGQVVAQDVNTFLADMQARSRMAAFDGVQR